MADRDDLKADYDRLGTLLDLEDDGAKAAALARERRMIRDLLSVGDEEVTVVDELAARRRTGTEDLGAASRRRRPGGG